MKSKYTNQRQERKLKLTRGCLTYGYIVMNPDSPDLVLCPDPKCGGCVAIGEAMSAALKKAASELAPEDFYDEMDPRGMSSSEWDEYLKARNKRV